MVVKPDHKKLCVQSSNTKANLSGRFGKVRQENLQSVLNANFVESPGKVASQETVMNVLDLCKSEKGLATRTVNNVFPSASYILKVTEVYENKLPLNLRKILQTKYIQMLAVKYQMVSIICLLNLDKD